MGVGMENMFTYRSDTVAQALWEPGYVSAMITIHYAKNVSDFLVKKSGRG